MSYDWAPCPVKTNPMRGGGECVECIVDHFSVGRGEERSATRLFESWPIANDRTWCVDRFELRKPARSVRLTSFCPCTNSINPSFAEAPDVVEWAVTGKI